MNGTGSAATKRILCLALVLFMVATLFLSWISLGSTEKQALKSESETLLWSMSMMSSDLEYFGEYSGDVSSIYNKLKDGELSPAEAASILITANSLVGKASSALSEDDLDENGKKTVSDLKTAFILYTVCFAVAIISALYSLIFILSGKNFSIVPMVIGFGSLMGVFVYACLKINEAASQSIVHMTVWFYLAVVALLVLAFRNMIFAGSAQQPYSGDDNAYYNPPTPSAGRSNISGVSGSFLGAVFAIGGNEEITMGRDPTVSSVVFASNVNSISRRHCTVRYDAGANGFYVTDWSKNGTFTANGVRLQPQTPTFLPAGTQIYLGTPNEQFRLG